MNDKAARALMREHEAAAVGHWEAGRLDEAGVCFRQALAAAPSGDRGLPEVHGAYGQFLAAKGENEAAEVALRKAVALYEGAAKPDAHGLCLARYFLAEHLLKMGRAQAALDTMAGFLGQGTPFEWLLKVVAAGCLMILGDGEGAHAAAQQAMALAPNAGRRAVLAARFEAAGIAIEG